LHEIVDVGVEGREMAAGAGRDPAPEGRVLKALREVAQRDAERLVLSTSSTLSSRCRLTDTTPLKASPTAGSTPPTTEEPPPNGITATLPEAAQSSRPRMSRSEAG
jgi:hypothetical protein